MVKPVSLFIISFFLSFSCHSDDFKEELRQIFGRTFEKILPICVEYRIDSDIKKTAFLNFADTFKAAHRQKGSYDEELRTAYLLCFTCFVTQGFRAPTYAQLIPELQGNLPNFLMHHLWAREFNKDPVYNNDMQEAFLAPEFQKTMDLIELAHVNPESNLLKDTSRNAVISFHELAEEMKKQIASADEKLPVFAKLAFLYLMKSVETGYFLKDASLSVFSFHHLTRDILERWQNKTSTYRWFMYTIQRILMTDYMRIAPHQEEAFNTQFNIYYMSFFKRPLFDQNTYKSFENFRRVVDDHASFNGRKRITPNALSNLFPHMVFLPFPFEMTPLQMITVLKRHEWWALGYAFGPKNVDNLGLFEPLGYYFHDIQHWDITRSFNIYFGQNHQEGPDIKLLSDDDLNIIKNYVKKGILLFDQEWRQRLCKIVEDEKEKTRQNIFALFVLDILHERVCGLHSRLASALSLLSEDFCFKRGDYNHLFKPHILSMFSIKGGFFNDLPNHIQKMSEDERAACIIDYLNQFRDILKTTDKIDEARQKTEQYLLCDHKNVDNHIPELKITHYDPTAFSQNMPDKILSQAYAPSSITWHYHYHFKFIHFNWNDFSAFERETLVDFAAFFPPFKTYPREGLLTPDNQGDDDWPKEAYTFDKIHFGSIMPDGQEIDLAIPLWIEKFSFSP